MLAVLAAAGLVAFGPAAHAVPATGRSAPGAAPTVPDQLPVRLVIEKVSPYVLRPGQPLELTGSVVNDGDEVLTGVHIRTRAQPRRVGTRFGLGEGLTDPGPLGTRTIGDFDLHVDLAAHASLPWSATLPADTLGGGARELAVYLVGAEVRAGIGSGPRSTVARTRVPVTFVPTGARFRPTRLAMLWPLVETPHRGPSAAYLDDSLAGTLSGSGRLNVLLTAGAAGHATTVAGLGVASKAAAPLPLTWVADPALLQGAADLADGYRLVDGKRTTEGKRAGPAGTWLRTATTVLRDASDQGSLITLPYADPDLAALTRNGLGTDFGVAARRGGEQVRDVLGVAPQSTTVWPAGGHVSADSLDALATSNVERLVLSGDALPLTERLNYTPDAAATVQSSAGAMPVMLTDSLLDSLLAAGVRHADPASGLAADGEPPSPMALVQRFLAETALITAELPSRPRDIVVAAPRRWDPDPQLVTRLLNRLGDVPWLSITPLSALRATPPTGVARGPLNDPPALHRSELPTDLLTQPSIGIAALRVRLRDLRSVLGDAAATATLPFDLALLRAESSQWGAEPATGEAVRHATASALIADSSRVRISSAGLITLTSQRGALPITLENGLDYPVTVRLRLSTPSRARLSAPEDQLRTIEAHHRRTLQVDAKAFTSGVFTVDAQLVTPDRHPYGPPVQLRVRSTEYGAIAVAITAGGLVVLAIAIIIRLTRRVLRSRRARQVPA
ncbi:MAG: hypothetical protein QOK42_1279 [Frankiaceae bacterium]|nr:hypothetical protein [Frankiaceae bacterium]